MRLIIVAITLISLSFACAQQEHTIVFTSDRTGNQDIYSITSTGENLTRLTNSSHNEFSPLVSPDGKLIVEYDSVDHRITDEALSLGVHSAATPLGGMMLAIGCGVQFINHDLSGGGRAGRRKLIGLRGKNNQNDRALSLSMINELENFLTWSKELDWLIQSKTRPIAIATITMLKEKFNL